MCKFGGNGEFIESASTSQSTSESRSLILSQGMQNCRWHGMSRTSTAWVERLSCAACASGWPSSSLTPTASVCRGSVTPAPCSVCREGLRLRLPACLVSQAQELAGLRFQLRPVALLSCGFCSHFSPVSQRTQIVDKPVLGDSKHGR